MAQYLSCQLSWRHPDVLLDAGALAAARSVSGALAAAGGGSLGSGGLLVQRLAAWRNALHSLYGTYRGGNCNMFYVISSVRQGSCHLALIV